MSSNCECEKGCSESRSMADRFSNLPCEVALHILSFLPVTDLTRFSCVSKRRRELYLSTPSLNFDLSDSAYSCASTCEKRISLLNSLDRFLVRRGDNKIQVFHVQWEHHQVKKGLRCGDNKIGYYHFRRESCICRNEYFRIITWVENAVRCKVEVLHLYIDVEDEEVDNIPSVPACVLLCGSLRTLVLHYAIHYSVILNKPSSFTSNLECLDLRNVDISEGFFEWLSSSCKCIKELSLDNCWAETITIQSSSLESFHYEFDAPDFSDLNIIAPNLKCMTWKANMCVSKTLQKCTALERVKLLLEPEADDVEILVEVLHSICSAKRLTLNQQTALALFEGDSIPALENVSYLCLHIDCFCDIVVPALASLCRGMPNLTTLEIISSFSAAKGCSGFAMGYWIVQDLAFIKKLEEVAIHMLSGSNAIEFASYILEHAQNLKKMRITHSPKQTEVKSMINKSKKVSNVRVVFENANHNLVDPWSRRA